MAEHLVFIPCSITESKSGGLYGIVKERKYEKSNTVCYFILNSAPTSEEGVDKNQSDKSVLIGQCIDDDDSLLLNIWIPNHKNSRKDAIHIRLSNGNFQTSFTSKVSQDYMSSVVVVVYDEEVFKHSELLRTGEHTSGQDHFQVLGALLQKQSASNANKFWNCFQVFWTVLLAISNFLLNAVSLAKPVFKYSALWLRLHHFLSSFSWALGSIKREKKV